jgi:hypothetical protein
MVYLRSKIVNGKRYFYLVESIREGKKVRQRVIRYIGTLDNLAGVVEKHYGKKR